MDKYHVTQREDGTWQGKLQKGERASVIAPTKQEAVQRTVEIAKNKPAGAQVFIHKQNGQFQEERTYPRSNDPYPPKG